VVGQGDRLFFLLDSQQASGQPLCALPFVLSGGSATLVPGSTCVTAGQGDFCTAGPFTVALQTFMSGSASLGGGTLTLSATDVFAVPANGGPECVPVPPGEDQVNVESLTATLQRQPDGG
jgi:hypothetical protein